MNLRYQKIIAWPICLIFMIGMVFAGTGNILCVGENGQIKFETICLPYCGEVETDCVDDCHIEIQNEAGENSDCSDVELDGPLRSNRIQNLGPEFLNELFPLFTVTTTANIGSVYTDNDNLQNIIYFLASGQSPPSNSISTTVLRC